MSNSKVYKIYSDFLARYGNPVDVWPQWCARNKNKKTKEMIVIGAILTQSTSWHNADLALKNLKKNNLFSLARIAALPNCNKLKALIRPAGFYQTKPRRLLGLARFIKKEYGSLERLGKEALAIARAKLLNLYGVGPETADTILLYALGKPNFVIDEYTRRLVREKNLCQDLRYESLKEFFEKNLPQDPILFQDFHALIIIDQKGLDNSLMEIVQ